ncbi:2-succinyl-6-hydroxy-2,4-cyclohexadiene-1-carboxylate synthase [Pseudanabaena mucicola]|uniref:Putative 2-succinyl-6-hydroxy-2,4-cyclohexadiene-1-carboxylate synthase n=1 Tax=Pseudanabaena mucicola FACHB-723 TaxID=2692860 RepID=A0ABR8A1C1_9CYAN|nr:2-succinyl-6-hydroxy-2,4-cyclohexadiene-1-carboxylate synthase [Pseudanabaena mucicola]MBD2189590.1 2-succinyl-6-hydroxy-2,4-cyclohexadiene-1-carboxylate synthase [Pseudanabaena mucicola FACHB-723]
MRSQVQIENYDISYYAEGNRNCPVILFLHGFMGDCFEFQTAIATLSKQFYCMAIDLLGHGQTQEINRSTEQERPYTFESVATLIIKFIEALGLVDHKRIFLVGYSMGGRIALYLAIHFPQYFSKVVLESASAGLASEQAKQDRLAQDLQIATKLETIDLRLFLENWYQQPIFGNLQSHPQFPQMLKHRLTNSVKNLAKSLRNLSTGKQPSLWQELCDNQVPLLLLVGELDRKFVQINWQMHQQCLRSQLEIAPKCSHNIHFENPQLFAEKILQFFS